MRRENFSPKKHSRLCSKHFRSTDYHLASRELLTDSVPSVFNFPRHLQKTEKRRRVLKRIVVDDDACSSSQAIISSTSLKVETKKIKLSILGYVGGYIVRKLLRNLSCERCADALVVKGNKTAMSAKDRGGLVFPSVDVFKIIRICELIFKCCGDDFRNPKIAPVQNLKGKINYRGFCQNLGLKMCSLQPINVILKLKLGVRNCTQHNWLRR